jgi:acetylornithine deacetylase/succinyl-diaminopimelate desuccinylase-like protein
MRFAPLTALAFAALAFPAAAETPSYPAAEAQVLDLTKQAIALRSVRGEGNQTPQVAELFRQALLAGGWAESDIDIVPVDDTAYLIATWPGSDPSLGPIVVSAHMDVVEAKPEDWERDPFTPVVEDGYLFGRGASDTKFDAVLAMSSLIDLRRSGFEPKRSIVIAYSGDEETTMKTSRAITDRLRDAALVLNVDGASGMFDDDTGRPLFWTWQGAEKTYVDFQLEVTNPGGHSSAPRPDNAIVDLSNALARIGAYRFKPELNDITRESLSKGADLVPDPELAAAMRAFAADPTDEEAISVLRADPGMIGQIGTTCVPTMVDGGHAENALPQRATAIVNCRIFPGHSIEEIMGELEQVAAEPKIEFSDFTGEDTIAAPASPLIPEYVAIFSRGIEKAWGEMPIFPAQSAGASDSMWYRAAGIPSYSVSPTFVRPKDEFSHGLNERVELRNIRPGITYYLSVFTDLASQ